MANYSTMKTLLRSSSYRRRPISVPLRAPPQGVPRSQVLGLRMQLMADRREAAPFYGSVGQLQLIDRVLTHNMRCRRPAKELEQTPADGSIGYVRMEEYPHSPVAEVTGQLSIPARGLGARPLCRSLAGDKAHHAAPGGGHGAA